MPQPRGRRHPLFLRLTKPIEPVYPDRVTPVAWGDDEPLERAQGVVYIVTRPCPQLRTWCDQLRKLHRLDKSHEAEEGVSRLSGAPLRPANQRALGTELEMYSARDGRVQSARYAESAFLTTTLMALITERVSGPAVGFVSFSIKWWWARALDSEGDSAHLEIELDQAWIAPAYRGRRWGEAAAIAIAITTKRHFDYIHDTTRWPGSFFAPLEVTVGADLYSRSGEALLAKCAEYVSIQFCLEPEPQRLEVSRIIQDGRW